MKRKGSFFLVRKWRTKKGKGGLWSEWFHISPWEVPNFRNLLGNILTQWAVVFGQIFEIWTNKFLKQFVSNVPLFILEYSDSVGELGCSWKRVK